MFSLTVRLDLIPVVSYVRHVSLPDDRSCPRKGRGFFSNPASSCCGCEAVQHKSARRAVAGTAGGPACPPGAPACPWATGGDPQRCRPRARRHGAMGSRGGAWGSGQLSEPASRAFPLSPQSVGCTVTATYCFSAYLSQSQFRFVLLQCNQRPRLV